MNIVSPDFAAPLTALLPLSLYVHIPWCIQKCPYCDFNSHKIKTALDEDTYVDALLADLQAELPHVWGRSVETVFIGGGTPSVFQAAAMQNLAAVYIQQKKYDDALSVLATPVDAAYRPLTDEAKGDVYAAQGKAKEAGEAYKAALDKLPEGSVARHSLQAKISQL